MAGCLEAGLPAPSSASSVWCCVGVSPLIWRRILVRRDSTIATFTPPFS
jgi:hypothetical protein